MRSSIVSEWVGLKEEGGNAPVEGPRPPAARAPGDCCTPVRDEAARAVAAGVRDCGWACEAGGRAAAAEALVLERLTKPPPAPMSLVLRGPAAVRLALPPLVFGALPAASDERSCCCDSTSWMCSSRRVLARSTTISRPTRSIIDHSRFDCTSSGSPCDNVPIIKKRISKETFLLIVVVAQFAHTAKVY